MRRLHRSLMSRKLYFLSDSSRGWGELDRTSSILLPEPPAAELLRWTSASVLMCFTVRSRFEVDDVSLGVWYTNEVALAIVLVEFISSTLLELLETKVTGFFSSSCLDNLETMLAKPLSSFLSELLSSFPLGFRDNIFLTELLFKLLEPSFLLALLGS